MNKKADKKKKKEQKPIIKENHHFVFIEAPLEVVSPEVLKWGEGTWWPKDCKTSFVREGGAGEVVVGTKYKQKFKVPLLPAWRVEITNIVPNKEVERTFITGMFKGYELLKLEWRYNGTRVDYHLFYEIKGIHNQILWPILGQKLHDKNIKMVLESLKEYCLKQLKNNQDQKFEGEE